MMSKISKFFWCTLSLIVLVLAQYTGANAAGYWLGTSGSTVYKSTDGSSWTSVSSTDLDQIASNGQYWLGTTGSTVYKSTDGSSWTSVSSTDLDQISSNGQYWLGTTGSTVYESTDGSSWTSVSSTDLDQISSNGQYWLGTTGSTVYESTDGSSWTSVSSTDLDQIESNGQYWLGTTGSTVYESTGGSSWTSVSSTDLSQISSSGLFIPPVSPSLSAPSGGVKQVTLTWTTSVDTLSYEVFRNGTSLGNQTSPFVNTGLADGTTYSYYVVARNAAGNAQSNTVSATTYLDITAPTGSFVINNDSQYTNSGILTLNFSISDGPMPLNEVSIYISNQNTTPTAAASGWQSYSTTKSYTYTGTEGTVTLYAWFKDKLNHISPIKTDSIIYDNTPAIGTMIINDGNPTSEIAVTLNFTKIFELANVNQIIISNKSDFSDSASVDYADGIENWPIDQNLVSGEKTIYAKYLDWAGNYSTPFSANIQYTYAEPTYEIIDEYKSIIGFTDEKIAGFDGYTIIDKYESEDNLYILFKSNTNLKVVDWQGNTIREKTITATFEYTGIANGYIVYKQGSNYYRDSLLSNSPQIIGAVVSGYTPELTPEGLFIQKYSTESSTIMNYYVSAWDINSNTLLYNKNGSFTPQNSDTDESGLSISADGWYVILNNYESYRNSSGESYFINKTGTLSGAHSWNETDDGDEDSLATPLGLILTDYEDDNDIYIYSESGTQHYTWGEESPWRSTYWWRGALSYQMIKQRGTGAGNIYTVSGLSYDEDTTILYNDEDYILATAGWENSSGTTYIGAFALLEADHTNKTFTTKWIKTFYDYPQFSASVDKENGLIYVYAKLSMTSQTNTDVWVLDFNTGKVLYEGRLNNSFLTGMYYAKNSNMYFMNNNIIYRRKFITPDNVGGSIGSKIYTVVKDKEFNILTDGQFTGGFNQDGIGIVAANASGESGITALTGTLTFIPVGTEKSKILKITIGQEVLYFKVVLPPSSTTITTVSFH